jgi:sortase A
MDVTAPITGSPPPLPPPAAVAAAFPPRPPRTRRRPPFEAVLLSHVLLMLSAGVLGFAVFLVAVSSVQQNNDQQRLFASFRQQLAEATAPTGGLIDPGRPVVLLEIPSLAMSQIVVEGTSAGDLQAGPGHRRDTPLPGQAGVSLVYGKAATFGAPFGQIDRLHPGDQIVATTGEGSFTYQVSGVRRTNDALPAPLASGAGRLTLETAFGAGLLQPGDTVYVDANLVGQPQPTPSGRGDIVPPAEMAMASDPSANTALVLWLFALGLVLAAIVWARRGWRRRESLMIGVPLVIAIMWNVYETVAKLLPNLL